MSRSITMVAPPEEGLFDRLAVGYDVADALSFGIAGMARRRAIAMLPDRTVRRIAVFMSGTGLDVRPILQRFPRCEQVTCYDNSPAMTRLALARWNRHSRVQVCQADVLHEPLENAGHDAVVMNFGWKTLDANALRRAAGTLDRVLRPGGTFCGCEFGRSESPALNALLRAHTAHIIPAATRVFGGDASAHAMLWQHLSAFKDGPLKDALTERFHVHNERLFGGLVRVFAGTKR